MYAIIPVNTVDPGTMNSFDKSASVNRAQCCPLSNTEETDISPITYCQRTTRNACYIA